MKSAWLRCSSLLRPALLLAGFAGGMGALCVPLGAFAQETTAAIRGHVTSADDGSPLAGAVVTVLHLPSGQKKTELSRDDGSFAFLALSVGGPYTVTAVSPGFVTGKIENVFLTAGVTRDAEFALRLTK